MAGTIQHAVKLRSNDMYTNGATGLRTSYYKIELDAPFDSVQWVISSQVRSGTPGTFKVQVAVTDEIAVDTLIKAFKPMRAGVVYDDLSANGWKNATFGGAATKQIALLANSDESAITMTTDPVALSSIARADGKSGYILLVKVVQVDSAGAFTQDKSTNAAWDAARGIHPWFREFFSSNRANVDGIATLNTGPTSVAESNTGYCMAGFPITTRTNGANPGELVLFTGDSIRAAAYSTFAFNNPNCQALMSLSTPARPISIVNVTGSGHSQVQYLQVAMDAINTGVRPTIIYMPGFSQNGFTNFTAFKTRNDAFMASVRAISGLENVKFILDTDYWGAPLDTGFRQCVDYAKSLANGTTIFCFDSEAVMTDFTNPSAPKRREAYMNADGVHAAQSGQDAITYGYGTFAGLVALYKSIFGLTTAVLPGAPVIGTATAGNGSVVVPFTVALNNGSAVLDYTVTAGGVSATGTSSPITVTGLPAGTAVTPTMRARNAIGSGAVSIPSNSVTPTAVENPVVTVLKDLSAYYSIDAPAPSYVRSDLQGIYSIGSTVVTVAANRVAKFAGRKRVVKFETTDPAYRGGKWYVAKGINDELFYAGDISKQLADSGTTAVSVSAIAVGITAITPPTLQGSIVVVKAGGFNIASDNYVTFRVVCANGERFDRTIIFERAIDDVVYMKDPDDQLFYAADVSEMLTSGVTTAVSFETIVAGVQRLSSLSVQGVVMPVLIGGFDIATGVSNYATFRVTCANGERFDKTIRFEREET